MFKIIALDICIYIFMKTNKQAYDEQQIIKKYIKY